MNRFIKTYGTRKTFVLSVSKPNFYMYIGCFFSISNPITIWCNNASSCSIKPIILQRFTSYVKKS